MSSALSKRWSARAQSQQMLVNCWLTGLFYTHEVVTVDAQLPKVDD